jgi:DNA-binding XRE family transcriptional regulator
LHQGQAPHEQLRIHVDQLLHLRGLQPKRGGQGRRGGYEPEQRAAMLSALAHIQNLYVSIATLPGDEHDRQGRHQRTEVPQGLQGRTFIITDAEGESPPNSALNGPDFVFRPGDIFAPLLVGPRRQTAWLPVKALQYDPYRQAWAKRMARYLTWQWRIRAGRGDYLHPYRVATLLSAVGERVDRSNPGRTKARLEKTLDLLQADHVIAAWQYTQGKREVTIHPGWATGWRQVTVRIDPPDAIREAYQPLKRLVARQSPVRLGAYTLGEQIKRRRRLLGLSQRRAAEQMGISQAFMNLLEHGRRGKRPSTTVQRQIEAWLTGDG